MNKEIVIIKPEEKYIEASAEISAKAWIPIREVNKKLLGDEIYSFLHNGWQEAKKEAVRQSLKVGKGFIALCEGNVVGFTTYEIFEDKKIGEILNNAVSPDAKGMGIAGLLNKSVLKHFKEKGCIIAKVSTGLDEGHAPARRAYEKLGFEKNLPQVEYYMDIADSCKKEDFEGFTITSMKEEDKKRVLEIAVESWEAIHKAYKSCLGEKLYNSLYPDWKSTFKKTFTDSFDKSDFYVAKKDGKIYGFCSARYERNGRLGIFGYNGVDINSRGMRIASKMYSFLKNEFSKKGCIYARVHTGLDNGHAPARRAYERTGFSHPLPMVTYYMKI
ncbi:MAG: GNAT family N-acetyltransferase [Ruminococcaceae bacterium]|nr:GNAT family N-acetyltransferase [Oscillospiraceae bacterium]